MLLDLVIWTSALALAPLILALLECWLAGGFAPAARGPAITVPPRRRPWPASPLRLGGHIEASPAGLPPGLRLDRSPAGLTEATSGDCTASSVAP